ncbi:MAG: hypothetical protein JW787_18555 [Sedimentisphaerales bacterium]|nr:hypothetical protein [Sedimentisphaerales bacterium]
MHTIDLLKGQALPPKTTLGSLVFTALLFVVPLLVGSVVLGMYAINKTNIDVQNGQIERLEKQIADAQPNTLEMSELEKSKKLCVARLGEVSKCVDTYLQWTPVLIALAENMPEKMIMDSLSASSVNPGGIKKSSDPNKTLVIPIPQKRMTAVISGRGTDVFNLKVQGYQKTLKSEQLLPHIKEITHLMQAQTADNQLQSFTMSFIFEKQKK